MIAFQAGTAYSTIFASVVIASEYLLANCGPFLPRKPATLTFLTPDVLRKFVLIASYSSHELGLKKLAGELLNLGIVQGVVVIAEPAAHPLTRGHTLEPL